MTRYALAALFALFAAPALAQPPTVPTTPRPVAEQAGNPWQWANDEGGFWWRWKATTTPATVGPTALEEVNARRARSGLPPFVEDPLLTQAAEAAAEYRAARLMAGHTSNDFAFVPAGGHAKAAGCAAWEPSWGWGSCCVEDHAQAAGAGWRMGRDGRRYMHLFVR